MIDRENLVGSELYIAYLTKMREMTMTASGSAEDALVDLAAAALAINAAYIVIDRLQIRYRIYTTAQDEKMSLERYISTHGSDLQSERSYNELKTLSANPYNDREVSGSENMKYLIPSYKFMLIKRYDVRLCYVLAAMALVTIMASAMSGLSYIPNVKLMFAGSLSRIWIWTLIFGAILPVVFAIVLRYTESSSHARARACRRALWNKYRHRQRNTFNIPPDLRDPDMEGD